MQQLTGLDEMFASVDTATANAVMGGLIVFERPTDPAAGSAERMIERITDRLDDLPPFRWTLARVPLAIGKDYWAEAADVDVADHVHEIALQDADDRALAAWVAQTMETGLRTDRPLWELYVVTGLQGGRLAHLLRVHHKLIDGTTIPTVLDILSDNPSADNGFPSSTPSVESAGRLTMLGRGLVGVAANPLRMAKLQASFARYLVGRVPTEGLLAPAAFAGRILPGPFGAPARAAVNLQQRITGKPAVAPVLPPLRKPRTPFNGKIEAERAYAFADLPLADFKAVGKAFGITLNDAVVAVCAGAVRRYLQDNGGVPNKPLVVCIPASLRSGAEKQPWANHVSMFFAELPTHLDDPEARMRAVHASLQQSKANFDALPTHLIRDASRLLPRGIFTASQQVLSRVPSWVPASPYNVVVSNVRGPSTVVEVAGARMAGYWPAAFLTAGSGLNITLQSYLDRVDFGFMGAANLTGDLWDLPGYMADELAALTALVEANRSAPELAAN
ncbi:MAG TPA: wax ester/triacylglycerol synthase family O-acyltransferase [Aldersonia sp.]